MNPDEEVVMLPPMNIAAEEAVLGALLIDPNEIPAIAAKLSYKDFWKVVNGCIYRAIMEIYDEGMAIDPITINARVTNYSECKDIEDLVDYLFRLMQSTPYTINARDYAQIVKEASLKRTIQRVANNLNTGLYSDEMTVEALIAKTQNDLAQIDHEYPGRNKGLLPVAQYASEMIDEYEDDTPGIKTGLKGIDSVFTMKPGDYVLIAGRPGMGKSGLVAHIAVNIGRAVVEKEGSGGVFFFTKEITGHQVAMRMACDLGSLSMENARNKTFTAEDQGKYYDALGRISQLPIRVYYGALSPASLRRSISQGIAEYGLPEVVIVDHLHLMSSDGNEYNQEQRITAISGAIKEMCLDFVVPFVVAAQLSRGPENRLDKEPELADLRGSGSLEQDGDTVIFIHRPSYYDKDGVFDEHEANLIFAKNRWGEAPKRIKLFWLGKAGTFRDIAYVPLDARGSQVAKSSKKYEEAHTAPITF